MPSQGAGPSRRSHTKSRKGCKTCKRRHIRCDETYPQCRNCTKHQVRCDYMESVSDSESVPSPEQASVLLSPNSEQRVEAWQHTGGFPFPELNVYPQPPVQELSRNELRLIQHLSSISSDLHANGNASLTIWAQKLPRLLSIASSYPYVMHALLSFSANHMAWANGSNETRSIHIHHGGLALRGLHEAISSFSQANADAVLAASLLMLWQSTDWRSWSSLRAGVQSVLAAMQTWNRQSLFAEVIVEGDYLANALRVHRRQPSLNPAERSNTFQRIVAALRRLQMGLAGCDVELYWIEQLLMYIQSLQTSEPASSPEAQFDQLYYLRKWLFWVPITLLRGHRGGQGPAMLTLAHFYATALVLEPLYPDLGPSFCSAVALAPLEKIIHVIDMMQSSRAMDAASIETASLMQFPRENAFAYRSQAAVQMSQPAARQALPPTFIAAESSGSGSSSNTNTWAYPTPGNLSPAFAPSTPSQHPGTAQRQQQQQQQQPHPMASSVPSWLDVPFGAQHYAGFAYGTQSWGMPSPGLPPTAEEMQEGQMYGYAALGRGASAGFVPASVWT